jgi:hypothetical protein
MLRHFLCGFQIHINKKLLNLGGVAQTMATLYGINADKLDGEANGIAWNSM